MSALDDVLLRREAAEDRVAVRRVNVLAFGTASEADLVEALHRDRLVLASIVAEAAGSLVGHILFSRMWVESPEGVIEAACLAPMAVLPSRQRSGIGSALVRQGIVEMQARGERVAIVVGHPAFYPRFGFERASRYGITSPFPEDVFMVRELKSGGLEDVTGAARYPAPFGL